VGALSAMGAGGAVCFASGFAETAEGARQAALVAAAGDMPLLGPNCYGFVNYLDGALLWPDQQGGRRVDRGVAVVSQSSNIAINLTMQARGLPIAYVVCVGNQAQTGLAEVAAALAADDRVTALGLYVEGVGDPVAFHAMAAAAGKPIVALKAGRSAAAQAAAVTHTASLAGGDAASRAFFARCGVAEVENLTELLEALKLLHVGGPTGGRRIASVSCSGGEASLAADAGSRRDLTFPAFSAAEAEAIRAPLNELVAIANPLDYHTFIWGDEERMSACFSAVAGADVDLTLFVIDFPRADRCDPSAWGPAVAAIKRAAAAGRVAVVATMPENLPEAAAEDLAAAGVAPLCGLDDALAAAEAAAPRRIGPPPAAQKRGRGGEPRLWSEAEAKAALSAAGLAAPEGRRAETPEAAAKAAAALGGRVALKRLGLAHKTEVGAVRLGLRADDVEAAARAMGDGPYLVERMVEGGVAELILGVSRDPAYGPVMTLGFGGTEAELLGDAATLILPVAAEEAEAALRSLRLAPLLDGWRGRPKADVAAAARAAAAISAFALAHADRLEELDVNPLIVAPDGAWAADALIRMRET
ncbi:MAG: acetate--CoA ligase family protein, partial [Pseudomonadota bacterium]